MEAKLIVVGGKANRSEVKLKLPAMVGRGRDADLTVAHATVSRHHCLLYELDNALIVRDNGSLNGTVVDGQRVQEAVLRPGQSLTIGPLTFRAEYQHHGEFPDLNGAPTPASRPAVEANGQAATSASAKSAAEVSDVKLIDTRDDLPQIDVSRAAASAPAPSVDEEMNQSDEDIEPTPDGFDFLDDDVATESSSGPSFGFLKDDDDEKPAAPVAERQAAAPESEPDDAVFHLADEPLVAKKDGRAKKPAEPATANGEYEAPVKVPAAESGAAKAADGDDAALDDFLNSLGLDD